MQLSNVKNNNDLKGYMKFQRNEELRNDLKALRERLGLSQAKMAEKLQSSKSDYRPNYLKMENGKTPVSKPLVMRIGQVFGDWSLWYQYIAPDLQEKARYIVDEEDRAILQNLIIELQKHFFEENKNIFLFFDERLQRFMEDWDYSFEWYASRMTVKVTRDDKRIDLDADEQQALTTAVKDAIDRFFDNKLAAMKAESNGEDEEEIYCI